MGQSRLPRSGWVFAFLMSIAATTLLGIAASTFAQPDENSYQVLDDNLEPFRSAFNAASDQARAVLLVGPT